MKAPGKIYKYFFKDEGIIPSSQLPVIVYKNLIDIHALLPAVHVKKIFRANGWTNTWRNAVYTYLHYHTLTHEAMAVIKGEKKLRLGGKKGKIITISKGDVIIIPAGVAHENLGKEKGVICIGGYPDGKDFDMNYGKKLSGRERSIMYTHYHCRIKIR